MLKKFILLISCALVVGFSAVAQDSCIKSCGKTWFAEGGLGLNMMYDGGKITPSFGSAFSAGYYFVPQFGARVSLQLGQGCRMAGETDWFSPVGYFKGALAAELFMNVMNLFDDGWSDNKYQLMPYGRLQETFGFAKGVSAATFGIGAGLRQSYKLDCCWDLFLDMNAVLTGEQQWKPNGQGMLVFGQVVFGGAYKF